VRPPAAVPAEPVFRLPAARAVRTAALPQIQRKWALLIGTDVYTDTRIPQLDNAVADVDAVARVLEGKLGYQTVVVRNGTKAAIVRAFNQLAAVVDRNDSVAIYYAGHGDVVEKTGLGYWQPSDAQASRAETWLSNTDIGKLLGQLGAQQVVLVSDSCFSGSLVSDERIRGSSGTPDVSALLSRRAAVVMSSGGNEPVFDSGKNGHSTFAWSFMQALEQRLQLAAGRQRVRAGALCRRPPAAAAAAVRRIAPGRAPERRRLRFRTAATRHARAVR
jgi:uncharacterized caspase-like protein